MIVMMMMVMMMTTTMMIMMTSLQGAANSLVFAIDTQTLISWTPTNIKVR